MAVSTFLVNTLTQALLLWIGTNLIESDKLTAEVMLAFMLYQGHLQHETLNIFMCYSSFIKCCGAGDKVFALLDRKPPPPSISSDLVVANDDDDGDDDDEGNASEVLNGSQHRDQYGVELQGVTFRYPSRPEQPVLNNLNLVIPKGKTIALCGSSGCGKVCCFCIVRKSTFHVD